MTGRTYLSYRVDILWKKSKHTIYYLTKELDNETNKFYITKKFTRAVKYSILIETRLLKSIIIAPKTFLR